MSLVKFVCAINSKFFLGLLFLSSFSSFFASNSSGGERPGGPVPRSNNKQFESEDSDDDRDTVQKCSEIKDRILFLNNMTKYPFLYTYFKDNKASFRIYLATIHSYESAVDPFIESKVHVAKYDDSNDQMFSMIVSKIESRGKFSLLDLRKKNIVATGYLNDSDLEGINVSSIQGSYINANQCNINVACNLQNFIEIVKFPEEKKLFYKIS